MDFKDITLEQATKIVDIWGHNAKDITVKYQPYIHEWYEDARELIIIEFVCPNFFGNSPRDVVIHIDSKLNPYVYYRETREDGLKMLKNLGGLSPFPYVGLMNSLGISPRKEFVPPFKPK